MIALGNMYHLCIQLQDKAVPVRFAFTAREAILTNAERLFYSDGERKVS